jgi:hypothetical protein
MWHHDYHAMQQFVRDRQHELMTAGERSRIRRIVKRSREQTVYRPTKTR